MKILPEDSREYARQIEALPARAQPSCCRARCCPALHRFGATRNIQDVAFAIRETCNLETDRLDSELSMVRFVAWAIPAIGFVGTVRGIGNSLQQAHKAVEGDVSGVVAGLGTSFNSTLVALSLSIVVMLCLHQMQLRQERRCWTPRTTSTRTSAATADALAATTAGTARLELNDARLILARGADEARIVARGARGGLLDSDTSC